MGGMTDSESQSAFKCIACGSDRCEPGRLNARWYGPSVFTPDDISRWKKAFYLGAEVRAIVCRECGFVHTYADLDRIDELTEEGHTRCRKCRHILKGLTAPRCPECGEPI